MCKLSALSVLLAVVCCGVAALNENIDIDISVDTDSKLYHQGKTVEGSFNYGYNVPRRNYNQYQHKVKGPDGVTYGCYGFVDPTNGTHLYHYVSDLKGYRVVPPNKPTRVYTERVANSVANIYDSVGVEYDWEKLYFPDVCRVLQRSKEQRNELSIPPGYQVNDDGSVTQTTTRAPKPVQPSTTTTRRPPPPPPPTTSPRPAPPTRAATRATPRPTPPTPRPTPPTPRPTPRPTTAQPRATPTPAREPPRPPPVLTTRPPVRVVPSAPSTTTTTTTPRTTARPRPPPTTARPSPPRTAAPTQPRPVPQKPSPTQAPKTNGNKFGTNRDNFIGSPSVDTVEKLVPPGRVTDLDAVGQNINELRTLLQMLLKTLGNQPKAAAGPDCDHGLGAVDPNAKHVFLPLVIVDSLPGAPRGAAGGAPAGVPPGSQFALPAVGYGASRCNTCG